MAASAVVWLPQGGDLTEICTLLEQQISPSSVVDKSQIWKQLQHFSHLPDFNNYLVFILVRDEGKSVEIRQAAGLLLKNNLRGAYPSMSQEHQKYIKTELLPCLGAVDRSIRTTVGTIISVIVNIEGVSGWPELLPALVTCLDSNDLNHMDGAMDALSKICEDIPHALNSEVPGLAESPFNVFLHRLYKFFQSPHASLRKLALGSVNQYIIIMPAALYHSMDKYLQGLFSLANDPVAEVRQLVCAAFVHLAQVTPSSIKPRLSDVMDHMLLLSNDTDKSVALKACEFWSAYFKPRENIKEILPRLIPVLLSNMAYADDDESLLDVEKDESQPDRDQDLKPHFHTSRLDFDDYDVDTWNLRKCSAIAVEALSNVYRDEILPALRPLILSKLSASGDEAWKERVAAVLALGAIAEGCINGLYPQLSEIVSFLLPLLDGEFPLMRSISCWTLSRFSKYLIQESVNQKGYDQFKKVLTGLLCRLLDTNKRVQEAACSAFATLEVAAAEKLVPHLELILQKLMCALGKYQRRNLRTLYNAIGTLAHSVGAELNKPAYLNILMPPLVAKWQQLSDSDIDLLPLLECFTSIAQALRVGFVEFGEPVIVRCKTMNTRDYLRDVTHPTLAEVPFKTDVCELAERLCEYVRKPKRQRTTCIIQRKLKRKISTETNVGLECESETEEVDLAVAIRLYVEVLNSSFSESARKAVEEAATAILDLAKNGDYVETIVENGAIPALVRYLESPWSLVVGGHFSNPCGHLLERDCAVSLGLIAASQRANQQVIVDAGAIVPIINLLKRREICCGCLSANAVIRRAADLVTHIAHDNPTVKVNIREKGGIPPLVELLLHPDDSIQLAAAGALRRVSFRDAENNKQIVELNALPTLVLMLQSQDSSVHGEAIGIIGNLVHSSLDIKKEVILAGALRPVINLLSSPCLETQKEAALLIVRFAASDADCKVHIAQRGATTPLINMLRSSDEQVMEISAFALGRLAQDAHNQTGIGLRGGIKSLLDLLYVKNESVQRSAAFALYGLADHEENVVDFVNSKAVKKLQPANFTAQATKESVARILKRLEGKVAVKLVLTQLLYLMRTSEKSVQVQIALSLAHLCNLKDGESIFLENNGIEFLWELLYSSSIKQQRYGASALLQLAKKDTQDSAPAPPTEQVFLGGEFMNDPTTSDVTFLVEGKQFYAHKSCLVDSSDAFRVMLNGEFKEREGTVEVEEIRWDVFELMMRFIYTGRIDIPKDLALDLLLAADKYFLQGLKRLCEYPIAQDICVENIQILYDLADTFNAAALRQACRLFFLEHFTTLNSQIWFPAFSEKVGIRRYITSILTRPI